MEEECDRGRAFILAKRQAAAQAPSSPDPALKTAAVNHKVRCKSQLGSGLEVLLHMNIIRFSFCGSHRLAILCFVSAPIFFFAQLVYAQGNLTPPGAPAATMKTLDQIEPRTPINQVSLPFTINASGSYYVTENLSVASGNAITINASGVTLDLSGFTITSTSATAAGNAV